MLANLHPALDRIAIRALLPEGEIDAELCEADAHALAGCSVCARALVNARDTAVDLALGSLVTRAPSEALRSKILARGHDGGVREPPQPPPIAAPGNDGESRKPPRGALDPSAAVAHRHIGAPGDAERTAEVDALAARTLVEGDVTPRVLAQIERMIHFPLLFVSVVRGERVGYRAQRGLERSGLGMASDLRREATFCTHCVSGEGPLVVGNAAREPFFRGSKMVRHGVQAYVGVPLRTSRGVVVGTLCALDFRPRVIAPEMVRALELFRALVIAQIERTRDPAAIDAIFERAGGASIHREGWFRELLGVELALVQKGLPQGRSAAIVVARGPAGDALAALAGESEVAGRVPGGAVGVLLAGAGAAEAEERAIALREGLRARAGEAAELRLAMARPHAAAAAFPSAGAWLDAVF